MFDHEQHRAEAIARLTNSDFARLRELRARARAGEMLKPPQHLVAAFKAGNAYRSARKAAGGRDAFSERALARLDLDRQKPATFNIQKHVLAKDITKIDPATKERYREKRNADSSPKWGHLPHRSLAHFLAIIGAAAEVEGRDADAAEIAFLRELSIWNDAPRIDAAEETWEAVAALHGLLDELARTVAKKTGLAEAFQRQKWLSMKWDAQHAKLALTHGRWIVTAPSPIYPDVEIGVNIDEVRPFPSVPLVRIPVGWGDVDIEVESGEACRAETPGLDRPGGRWEKRRVALVQFRDVRLGLALVDDRKVGPVLMSRGAVGLDQRPPFGPMTMIWGTMHWFETLTLQQEAWLDGGWRRVRLPCDIDAIAHVASGEAGDWDWEHDPVSHPGSITMFGADYVSFTPMTIDHLYHWLIEPHTLSCRPAHCPWEYSNVEAARHEYPEPLLAPGEATALERFYDGVPVDALACPVDTPARWIEANLYNGRFEASLHAAARRVVDETHREFSRSRSAARAAQERLRSSWS